MARTLNIPWEKMLKDLTRGEWRSFLGLGDDRHPEVLVLRGTRNPRTNYDTYAGHFEDVVAVESPNGLFEDVFIGRYLGIEVAYASVYGGAMASEITHVFGVLGASLVIQTGVCGAIGSGIATGDLVIAAAAGCGEGAAHCYLPGRAVVTASAELVSWVERADGGEVARHTGPIWTTAALLAEGRAELERWHGQGYIAVDMETASTFAVAEYFGLRRIALLSVFDNPLQGDHLLLTLAGKAAARRRGEQAMFRVLFSLIEAQASLAVPDR